MIEKKFESEIKQYDREAAGMLSNHLHNTIQLMETMKQVKRNSGQMDSDMKGVSVLRVSFKVVFPSSSSDDIFFHQKIAMLI